MAAMRDGSVVLPGPILPVGEPKPPKMVLADSRNVKHLIIMSGLPARGKSYIARKIACYYVWKGMKARLFNVGNHRREVANQPQLSNYFDFNNVAAREQREQIAFDVLESVLDWLEGEGELAILDATNSRRERRRKIVDRLKQFEGARLNFFFLEIICDDPAVVDANLEQKIANSPDYRSMPPDAAMRDLRERLANYQRVWEPLADDEGTGYIKAFNLQTKVVCYNLHGHIALGVAGFVMSLHLASRPILLVRAGKASMLEDGTSLERVRAEAFKRLMLDDLHALPTPARLTMARPLSAEGRAFAVRLRAFLRGEDPPESAFLASPETDAEVEAARLRTLSTVSAASGDAEHGAATEGRKERGPLPMRRRRSSSTKASFSFEPESYGLNGGGDSAADADSDGEVGGSPEERGRHVSRALEPQSPALYRQPDSSDRVAPSLPSGPRPALSKAASSDEPSEQRRDTSSERPRWFQVRESGLFGKETILTALASTHDRPDGAPLPGPTRSRISVDNGSRPSATAADVSIAPGRSPDGLAAFPRLNPPVDVTRLRVYTSIHPRAVQTAEALLPIPSVQLSALNMLDTGLVHGMTLAEIERLLPEEYDAWCKDQLGYRIPGGESYLDLVNRLDPFVIELERTTDPVLVIGHWSSLQVLFGYLFGLDPRETLKVQIPRDCVICLTPTTYGPSPWQKEVYYL